MFLSSGDLAEDFRVHPSEGSHVTDLGVSAVLERAEALAADGRGLVTEPPRPKRTAAPAGKKGNRKKRRGARCRKGEVVPVDPDTGDIV